MTISRTVLLLAGLMFGGLGVWLTLAPGKLEDWVGIQSPVPAARTELRALYGGLELGLGVFMLLGWARAELEAPACLALGLIMLGVALARMLGLVLDGSGSATLWTFLATEIVFAVLGFVGYAIAKKA